MGDNGDDPLTFNEAVNRSDAEQWKGAMQSEPEFFNASETWMPVEGPSDAPVIDTKFVFVTKRKPDGTVGKHKARLVAKGFQQGNVNEVYAPVIHFTNWREVFACGMSGGGIFQQLDMKTAFLNGKIDENEKDYVRPSP